jgi:hypothetical protein
MAGLADPLSRLSCGMRSLRRRRLATSCLTIAVFLGMTAPQLCALLGCRILQFMIHVRISFGGVLVAIAVLYLWLTLFLLRRRESWAWWALALSSAGFLSFLAYLWVRVP